MKVNAKHIVMTGLGALAFLTVIGTVSAAEAPEEKQLVKVCSLSSVEANQEFQRNVQIVQAQRQRLVALQAQLAQAQTDDLKKVLQKELDQELAKLNDNNKKMVETYGFSLNRNYILVTEKAHVYMVVTDDEANTLKTEASKKK